MEHVGRAAQPRRQRRRRRFAAPEVAHGVAELVVPLRPARREAADLVAAGTAVPRLGDQLHLGEQRILRHRLHEAVVRVEAARLAREDGAEVEAEAVDVHVLRPSSAGCRATIWMHARVRQIQRVAGAGVVDVIALLVRHQPVVGRVVDALEGQGRAELVAFGGVVEDDVDDHFEARIVEARDHLLEFLQRLGRVGGIARIRREEADRVIAPVIRQASFQQKLSLMKVCTGSSSTRRDAERLDVADHVLGREPAIGAALLLGNVGVAAW